MGYYNIIYFRKELLINIGLRIYNYKLAGLSKEVRGI